MPLGTHAPVAKGSAGLRTRSQWDEKMISGQRENLQQWPASWPQLTQQPDSQPSVLARGDQVSTWFLQGKGWGMVLCVPSA